jgi:hypothetical protein
MTAAERVDKIKNGSPFNRLDIVFLGAIVLLVTVTLLLVYGGGKGASVEITTPTQKLTYPLDKDAEVDVEGKLTVVIKDGKVFVKDADCPDKVCERTGAVNKSGSVIACLPNGITVTVTGSSDFAEVG